jgi:hypothetical protein
LVALETDFVSYVFVERNQRLQELR